MGSFYLQVAAPIDCFKALQDAGDSVSSDAAKQLKGMKVRRQVDVWWTFATNWRYRLAGGLFLVAHLMEPNLFD